MAQPDEPEAAPQRPSWWSAPETVRRRVEELLAGRVTEAVTQPGGYSPGVAARLRLADGRRAFVKAAGPEPNPDTPRLHRAEAKVAAVLPPAAPVPRLLGSFDEDGWVTLVFEDVDGRHPRLPWDPGELRRVLDALAELADALTPSPVQVPPVAERFGDHFLGWKRLVEAHEKGSDGLTGLDEWAHRNLDRLAELEETWGEAAAGETLTHADLRADNILLARDGVVVVDWPWACTAAPWFDLLAMLPSVPLDGGPPPDEVFDVHPVARGADPGAVTAVVAAVAGYLVQNGRLPSPPGLPTLRAFQTAQGEVALAWLRARTGWR